MGMLRIRARRRRRHTRHRRTDDTWMRVRAGLRLLGMVLAVGTIGYTVLGLSPGDALYQTVITITTVGYREIGEVTTSYKAFTILLVLSGTGTALYTLGVLIESLFEGRLDDQIRRRRMKREIDKLNGHVVLAGFGQVGHAIFNELINAGREVVVIDRVDCSQDPYFDTAPIRYNVVGEATDDRTLLDVGIERADTLVLALDHDADNLFVAFTARSFNPGLFIVARANAVTAKPKLRRAGADHIVNPHEIGGSKMASLVLSASRKPFPVFEKSDLESHPINTHPENPLRRFLTGFRGLLRRLPTRRSSS